MPIQRISKYWPTNSPGWQLVSLQWTQNSVYEQWQYNPDIESASQEPPTKKTKHNQGDQGDQGDQGNQAGQSDKGDQGSPPSQQMQSAGSASVMSSTGTTA